MADVHDAQTITIAGTVPSPITLQPSPRTVVVDGVRVELEGDAVVGETSELAFTFTDAATGRPVDDLQPYLAAAGHVVIMRADGETFAHEHADVEDADGDPVFALPGQEFGPELDVHAEFATPRRLPAVGPVPHRRRRRPHRPVHRPGPLKPGGPLP